MSARKAFSAVEEPMLTRLSRVHPRDEAKIALTGTAASGEI